MYRAVLMICFVMSTYLCCPINIMVAQHAAISPPARLPETHKLAIIYIGLYIINNNIAFPSKNLRSLNMYVKVSMTSIHTCARQD